MLSGLKTDRLSSEFSFNKEQKENVMYIPSYLYKMKHER